MCWGFFPQMDKGMEKVDGWKRKESFVERFCYVMILSFHATPPSKVIFRSLAKELSPKSRFNRSRFLVVQIQILRLSMSRNLGVVTIFFSALVYSPPMVWFGWFWLPWTQFWNRQQCCLKKLLLCRRWDTFNKVWWGWICVECTCATSVACFLEDFADVNIEVQLWIGSRQVKF